MGDPQDYDRVAYTVPPKVQPLVEAAARLGGLRVSGQKTPKGMRLEFLGLDADVGKFKSFMDQVQALGL